MTDSYIRLKFNNFALIKLAKNKCTRQEAFND